MRNALLVGRNGEDIAKDYLNSLGWRVVSRNWRCDFGEIDIGALEPVAAGPPTAVVVEVKTRSGLGYGDPLEAITFDKAARLSRLAARWAANLDLPYRGLRVDGVAILLRRGFSPLIRHVKNIGGAR